MAKYQDKKLQCLQCNQEFVWTAGEQKFYAEKGLENEPKTCPTCRQNKNRSKSVELTCEKCGSKGHIKTEKPDKIKGKSVICQRCLDSDASSDT